MDKKEFREICIGRLRNSNRVSNYHADKIVSQKLYRYIKESGSRVVMLYIPLKIEINIINLITQLRKEKVILFVPFMVGKSFRLVKYRLPIKVKKFGVREPNISNNFYKRIDLAIVPVIGIDKTFRRVGFGKGFYDRFFEKHREMICRVLFVGRKSCICSEIITDDYDVEGDFYITPNRVFDKKHLK
jgi:5-formyltetrahydrofolate cyclo-ligase